jgi:hypothetical protein
MAQAARGEDGLTDGMRGEKSVITRIGQKPNVGRWSLSKGQGQGRTQAERDQSERSRRRSTSQLNKTQLGVLGQLG